MLVVYSNKETPTEIPTELTEEKIDDLSRKAGIIEREINTVKSPVIWTPENLEKLAEHLEKIQKEKFSEEEKTEDIVIEDKVVVEESVETTEIKIEDEVVEPQEEIIIDNQTVEELKDKLAEDPGIKRLTYTKHNV